MVETPNTHRTKAGDFPVYCNYDELQQIDKLVPNPRNPNTHSKLQIEMLARIIKGQGWRAPITISTRSGFIIRGHGRLAAARLLNIETVPVELQHYDNEAAEFADLIADNKIAELAVIDRQMLDSLVSDLSATPDFDMQLLGMTAQELMDMLNKDVQEPEEKEGSSMPARTKRGDLYELGKHRLLCGDSTNMDDVKKLIGGGVH